MDGIKWTVVFFSSSFIFAAKCENECKFEPPKKQNFLEKKMTNGQWKTRSFNSTRSNFNPLRNQFLNFSLRKKRRRKLEPNKTAITTSNIKIQFHGFCFQVGVWFVGQKLGLLGVFVISSSKGRSPWCLCWGPYWSFSSLAATSQAPCWCGGRYEACSWLLPYLCQPGMHDEWKVMISSIT